MCKITDTARIELRFQVYWRQATGEHLRNMPVVYLQVTFHTLTKIALLKNSSCSLTKLKFPLSFLNTFKIQISKSKLEIPNQISNTIHHRTRYLHLKIDLEAQKTSAKRTILKVSIRTSSYSTVTVTEMVGASTKTDKEINRAEQKIRHKPAQLLSFDV